MPLVMPMPSSDTSILDDVQVATPCSADWDAMKGDDRVRFCASCAKNVYNLSGMPRAEAAVLLRAHAEDDELCVRLFRREDGTVMSGDCSVGVKRRRVRRLAMFAAGTVTATFAFGGFAAMTVTMGARARPEPPEASAKEAEMKDQLAPAPAAAAPSVASAASSASTTSTPSTTPDPASSASAASVPPNQSHVMGRRRR